MTMAPSGDGNRVSERRAREWATSFVIASGGGSRVLHLPESNHPDQTRPLCRHPTGSDTHFIRKDVNAYPPGYNRICENCRERLFEWVDRE